MKLTLHRTTRTQHSTIGRLSVDGVPQCYALEDVCRPPGEKVWGQTAIPAGTYGIILNVSNRFKKRMPLLLDVPGFAGVRIHSGNTAADTEGCLLVGTSYGTDVVYQSRQAFMALMNKLEAAVAAGQKITLTIK